ncbi:MAG: SNF2-related protein [Microthrixaceae bacterium]
MALPVSAGSGRFLHQFGTFQFVTKEFEDTLTTGKRRLIPAVSNLTRLWRLLSPTSIRRLKADFLPDLPAKNRHIHHVPMDAMHAAVYSEVAGAAKDILDRELRKDDPNMGAISKALWWMRYAASVPSKEGLPYFENALGEIGTAVAMTMGTSYPKVRKIVDLCQAAKAQGREDHRLHVLESLPRRAGQGAERRRLPGAHRHSRHTHSAARGACLGAEERL